MKATAIVLGALAVVLVGVSFLVTELRHSHGALTVGVVLGLLAAGSAALEWLDERGHLVDQAPAARRPDATNAEVTALLPSVRAGSARRPARAGTHRCRP